MDLRRIYGVFWIFIGINCFLSWGAAPNPGIFGDVMGIIFLAFVFIAR